MSIRSTLDAMSRNLWGRTLDEAHSDGICIRCAGAVTGLSEADEKEYRISGFCPQCFAYLIPDDDCE